MVMIQTRRVAYQLCLQLLYLVLQVVDFLRFLLLGAAIALSLWLPLPTLGRMRAICGIGDAVGAARRLSITLDLASVAYIACLSIYWLSNVSPRVEQEVGMNSWFYLSWTIEYFHFASELF